MRVNKRVRDRSLEASCRTLQELCPAPDRDPGPTIMEIRTVHNKVLLGLGAGPTADVTVSAVGAVFDQATINTQLATLAGKVNELVAAVNGARGL